jgi:hypothetical protein
MGFLLSLCGASAAGDAAGLGVVKGSQILQVNTSKSVDTIRGYTEEEFLWRAADTTTVLNGTAAAPRMEF